MEELSIFECISCSRRVETDAIDARCTRCASPVLLNRSGARSLRRSELEALPAGVWRFRELLPPTADGRVVSLGEGATPMLAAERLGGELGFKNLFVKDETRNPTGSFMDRGSTVLLSLAKERGIKKISCITTGNLGASLAAYCAKAGIDAEIGIHPNTDHGKLYQMIAYGARVEILSKTAPRYGPEPNTVPVSAGNPFILEGEKTTGFEIIQDMDWKQPTAIVIPVGTGGHLTMISRSLRELHEAGLIGKPACRLIGVQLQASAPIVDGVREVKMRSSVEEESLTELEESEPLFKKAAMEAIEGSGGHSAEVSAKEAIQATGLLARTEGIFAEPAAASVVAALKAMRNDGLLGRDDRVVCVITGAGLKDTKAIRKMARTPKHVVTREELVIKPMQVGVTKLSIMRALSSGPTFGYNLWKGLSRHRRITTASVYQHLSELEGIALVRRSGPTTVNGRERVFYELTKKGAGFLKMAGNTGVEVRFEVD